jgi:CDP-diacylglycerol--glycerol-3-phosphate 3-phosphatidyltransferase
LAGVPVFLWLLLGPHADLAALLVLAFAGISDYLDGKIARALGQTSKLGVVLDPAADRLYILATLVAFVLRGIIPWWLAAIIVGRDLVLAPGVWLLRRRGIAPLNVSYLGKSATFCLLYAFPLLLIGAHDWAVSDVARPIAWAFVWWGTVFYLLSGVLYGTQVVRVIRADRAGGTDRGADAG